MKYFILSVFTAISFSLKLVAQEALLSNLPHIQVENQLNESKQYRIILDSARYRRGTKLRNGALIYGLIPSTVVAFMGGLLVSMDNNYMSGPEGLVGSRLIVLGLLGIPTSVSLAVAGGIIRRKARTTGNPHISAIVTPNRIGLSYTF